MYISDLTNNHVWFLDRKTGKVLGTIGSMGQQAGSSSACTWKRWTSKNNIYTGEVFYGERVQRFVPAK